MGYLAWFDDGLGLLHFRSDSDQVVLRLKNDVQVRSSVQNLLKAIRKLLARDWLIEISYVYGESNRAADHLASMAIQDDRGIQFLQQPPTTLQPILEDDKCDVAWSRRVPIVTYDHNLN